MQEFEKVWGTKEKLNKQYSTKEKKTHNDIDEVKDKKFE